MGNKDRALATRTIVVWGTGLVLVAAAAATLLLALLGGGTPADSARLDALRTAASIVVGTGGAAALLLAARRQRWAELDLEQKEHDATERRVTEMYSRAADQLGSDKAPVRLAGLYALERLAQSHQEQRQTIVNVVCAYLRMPFKPSARGTAEELQVRKTAQRILMLHLRPANEGSYWPDIDLDVSGATLVEPAWTYCTIRSLRCDDVTFVGSATFRGTRFGTKADFDGARFKGPAEFRGVVFGAANDSFAGVSFEGPTHFSTDSAARLAGARATSGAGHTWPAGWVEGPVGEDGMAALLQG